MKINFTTAEKLNISETSLLTDDINKSIDIIN
jgi:hypothetical protein